MTPLERLDAAFSSLEKAVHALGIAIEDIRDAVSELREKAQGGTK